MWFGLGRGTIIALTILFRDFSDHRQHGHGREAGRSDSDPGRRVPSAPANANLRTVILPASVPAIAAGLRLGIGRALIGTVVGEFFGANAGLGFRIAIYGTEMNISNMFVPVVVVIIGVSLTRACGCWKTDLNAGRS